MLTYFPLFIFITKPTILKDEFIALRRILVIVTMISFQNSGHVFHTTYQSYSCGTVPRVREMIIYPHPRVNLNVSKHVTVNLFGSLKLKPM